MYQNRFKRDGRVFKCQTFGTIQYPHFCEIFVEVSDTKSILII